MEQGWERTFPLIKIDKSLVYKLFENILISENILNILPINSGCRTTNYIIETDRKNKFVLKIFFEKQETYKKEIKLSTQLRNELIPVPKIYKCGVYNNIVNRKYIIYEYIEGKSLSDSINEGYKITKTLVKEVARTLAKIHSYKFENIGFLDENLDVIKIDQPLNTWYSELINENVKKRLGEKSVYGILNLVKNNLKSLKELDKDSRLIHGDFQGTNILIKDGHLNGILDWEFVMAGNPLSDIGQFFRYEEYFDEMLIFTFQEEYNKVSDYKLPSNWQKLSKLRDLINLLKLINTKEDMPIKHENIRKIINNTLKQYE